MSRLTIKERPPAPEVLTEKEERDRDFEMKYFGFFIDEENGLAIFPAGETLPWDCRRKNFADPVAAGPLMEKYYYRRSLTPEERKALGL